MLLVELAAGGVEGGMGMVPGAGIGGPNGNNNTNGNVISGVDKAALIGGGKGGSVGRYTAPGGARHGRFSVDVSRLAQLAIGGGQNIITNITNLTSTNNTNNTNNTSPANTSTTNLLASSGSDDGSGSPGLNSSTDSFHFKMPVLNYSAKTAVCF